MGYGSESRHGMLLGDAVSLAPIALQTPADKAVWTSLGQVTVLRVAVMATVATTAVAAVIEFDKRITYGSDTGRTAALSTLTVPIGTPISGAVYKDCNIDLNPGEQLVAQLITAATAGTAFLYIEYIPRTGTASNLVKSV